MAGRKIWTQETLSVPDLQEYLQDQVVLVFTNTAQRSAQVTDPTEGMVSYLQDTDTVAVYSGTVWRALAWVPDAWTQPALNSGYTNSPGYQPLRYRREAGDVLRLEGVLSVAPGGTIFTLPVGFRPTLPKGIPVTVGASAASWIEVQANGSVVLLANPGATYVIISGAVVL